MVSYCHEWRWTVMVWLMSTTLLSLAGEAGNSDLAHSQRGRYLEATAAAQRGDYALAYYLWRPMAEQGDAEAQYALGWIYHNGNGLVIDDQAARKWWDMAIAQGHSDAMFALGTLYSTGSDTIPRDYVAAMRLWVEASAKGNQNARMALRELMQRNLPELMTVTQILHLQYPDLMGPLIQETSLRLRSRKSRALLKNSEGPTVLTPFATLSRRGELIALAVGYRPEVGWAAAQLFLEGEALIAENSH